MKAIGYTRVSTAQQVDDGVSIDAQIARIRAWCAANGYDLVEVFTDAGLSGSRADNRPALQSAIEAACSEKAALVVYSLSRLARSTRDAINISERLDKAGADLVSLSEHLDTTSAAGKMVFRMMAVLAEFERDQVAERTSAAMRYKQSKNEYIGGGVPFGFSLHDDGVQLVEDPVEQETINLTRALRRQGWSYGSIADELQRRGYTSRRGGPFSAKAISRMVVGIEKGEAA